MSFNPSQLKFIYSEKGINFSEISTLLLSTVHKDKSKVEISQNFVAFSEYMNFMLALGFFYLTQIVLYHKGFA